MERDQVAVGLGGLPVELMLDIGGRLDQPWDLNALVRTDRFCCANLRPMLFRRWCKRALLWAARHGRCEVMKVMLWLLEEHHDVGALLNEELTYVGPLGDEWGDDETRSILQDYVLEMSEPEPNLDQTTTALHVACAFGHVGTVNYLLDHGASAKASYESLCIRMEVLESVYAFPERRTPPSRIFHPIHAAICCGQESVAHLLLDRGYPHPMKGSSPETREDLISMLGDAINYTAVRGMPKLFSRLMDQSLALQGVNVRAARASRPKAHLGTQLGEARLRTHLPRWPPNPRTGSTVDNALAYLSLCGNYDAVVSIAEDLERLGVCLNDSLTFGLPADPPLHVALKFKNFSAASAFLACGASSRLRPALHPALREPDSSLDELSVAGWYDGGEKVEKDRIQYVKDLFAQGYQLSKADVFGDRLYPPAFIEAASHGLIEVMELLLRFTKPDVNYGWGLRANTALTEAACYFNVKAVEFLLQAGASVKAVDETNGRAEDFTYYLARQNHSFECQGPVVKLLLQHGANAGFRYAPGNSKPDDYMVTLSRQQIRRDTYEDRRPRNDPGWLANAIKTRSLSINRNQCTDQDRLIDLVLEHSTETNISRDHWALIVSLVLQGPTLPLNILPKLARFGARVGYRLTDEALRYYFEFLESSIAPMGGLYDHVDVLFFVFGDGMSVETDTGILTRKNFVVILLLMQCRPKISSPERGKLISSLLNPLVTSKDGWPLNLAAEAREESLMRSLLKLGIDVNFVGFDGYTPLKSAVGAGISRNTVRVLLDNGADPWTASDKRAPDSPTQPRDFRPTAVVVKDTISRLARERPLDNRRRQAGYGKSPFELAFHDGHAKFLEEMLTPGPKRLPAPSPAVFDVLWPFPSPATVTAATECEKAQDQERVQPKMSVLVWACLTRAWALVPLLLAAGANPDGAAAETTRPLPLLVSQAVTFCRSNRPFHGDAWLAAFSALRDAGADMDAPLIRHGSRSRSRSALEEAEAAALVREDGHGDDDGKGGDEDGDNIQSLITAKTQIMHLAHLQNTHPGQKSIFIEKVLDAVFGAKTKDWKGKGKEREKEK